VFQEGRNRDREEALLCSWWSVKHIQIGKELIKLHILLHKSKLTYHSLVLSIKGAKVELWSK